MSPFDGEYTIQEDVDDLDAVLQASEAHDVFGLSTGGLIVLKAALSLRSIERIAVYEPALSVKGSTPLGAVDTKIVIPAQAGIHGESRVCGDMTVIAAIGR